MSVTKYNINQRLTLRIEYYIGQLIYYSMITIWVLNSAQRRLHYSDFITLAVVYFYNTRYRVFNYNSITSLKTIHSLYINIDDSS